MGLYLCYPQDFALKNIREKAHSLTFPLPGSEGTAMDVYTPASCLPKEVAVVSIRS